MEYMLTFNKDFCNHRKLYTMTYKLKGLGKVAIRELFKKKKKKKLAIKPCRAGLQGTDKTVFPFWKKHLKEVCLIQIQCSSLN